MLTTSRPGGRPACGCLKLGLRRRQLTRFRPRLSAPGQLGLRRLRPHALRGHHRGDPDHLVRLLLGRAGQGAGTDRRRCGAFPRLGRFDEAVPFGRLSAPGCRRTRRYLRVTPGVGPEANRRQGVPPSDSTGQPAEGHWLVLHTHVPDRLLAGFDAGPGAGRRPEARGGGGDRRGHRRLGGFAEALLSVTVCDPACGSGHFLVAAARRIAKRVAAVREHNPEPGLDALRTALREVASRCIYGVDLNPMAVELAKVSLWLEALDPGKALSFLDAHIKQGNGLIGTTPALIERGIPDEAFKAIEGDMAQPSLLVPAQGFPVQPEGLRQAAAARWYLRSDRPRPFGPREGWRQAHHLARVGGPAYLPVRHS